MNILLQDLTYFNYKIVSKVTYLICLYKAKYNDSEFDNCVVNSTNFGTRKGNRRLENGA
jgi:hypothetical protein